MESRRAEAFSDGVFAVAITVLVFNLLPIAKPGIGAGRLGDAWPQYAAYVVSFLTIGIMWLNHHTVFSRVGRVDRITLVLNLLLLMSVVAVPFPTALVAANLGPGSTERGARVATVIYGLVMIVMSIAFSSLWRYMSSHAVALGGEPSAASLHSGCGSAGAASATWPRFSWRRSPLRWRRWSSTGCWPSTTCSSTCPLGRPVP